VSAPVDGHAEVRYEQSDVRAGAIVRFAIGLVIVVAVAAVGLLGLFKVFARQQRRHDPPPPPLAQQAGRQPPGPRLQTSPLQDLEQLRAQEEKELTSYGWVDPKAGIVHIPIDEAIKIVAARGLPQAVPSPSTPSSPSAAPRGTAR
jgi:cytoskeletal protein RodZ